jgi:hypothetical protein
MADPLSIAFGVVGLSSQTIQTTSILTRCVNLVKNAKREANNLTVKCTASIFVLAQLEQFIEKQAVSGHFIETSVLYDTTKPHSTSLTYLELTLSNFVPSTSKNSGLRRSFWRWPMTKGEHKTCCQYNT